MSTPLDAPATMLMIGRLADVIVEGGLPGLRQSTEILLLLPMLDDSPTTVSSQIVIVF